ncbi:MAG: MarR family winged helix-turn-helix transcriptional regulator, partial [Ktedonobacteraceae bacterium]
MIRKKRTITASAENLTETVRSPLWSRPGFLVRRLHQIHSALFFEECAKFNITPIMYSLLTVLFNQTDSDQVTIASEVGIDRTNVADVLQRLSKLGLVERRRSKTDRRSVIPSLTRKGVR